LFLIPHYFELKTIPLGFPISHLLVIYFQLPLI